MSELARTFSLGNPGDALNTLRPPLVFLNEAMSHAAALGEKTDLSPQALEGLAVICHLLAIICTEAEAAMKK